LEQYHFQLIIIAIYVPVTILVIELNSIKGSFNLHPSDLSIFTTNDTQIVLLIEIVSIKNSIKPFEVLSCWIWTWRRRKSDKRRHIETKVDQPTFIHPIYDTCHWELWHLRL